MPKRRKRRKVHTDWRGEREEDEELREGRGVMTFLWAPDLPPPHVACAGVLHRVVAEWAGFLASLTRAAGRAARFDGGIVGCSTPPT